MSALQENVSTLYADRGDMTLQGYMELKKALHEGALLKAKVGQVQHGVPFSGEYAPLVAQSIDKTWTSETFGDKHMFLANRLTHVDVMSTLHEVVTVEEWGQEVVIEGFFAEGGVTEEEVAKLQRKIADIKYLGVKRSLTDPASMTGIIGGNMVSRKGLAFETKAGIMSLKGRYETNLWNADSNLSPLHFDGVRSQIEAKSPADHVDDLRGDSLSITDFINKIYAAFDQPNYAEIDVIVVPGAVLGHLITEASSHGRHRMGRDRRLVYNNEKLTIVGPTGEMIDVVAAPKMNIRSTPWFDAVAGGVTNSTKAPTVGSGDVSTAVAADAASKFDVADAGAYYYSLLAVGDRGAIQLPEIGPINVSAGDRVRFTIDDDSNGAEGVGSLRYYQVYRTKVGGGSGNERYMWRWARNDTGGGNATIFDDLNAYLPDTSPYFGLTTTPDALYVAQLLGTIRRPLAETETSKPFMIMKFVAPHLTHPRKHLMWKNGPLSW